MNEDDMTEFDRWWNSVPRWSVSYQACLDAWRSARTTCDTRCDTCQNWTPNSRLVTGKCRVLKLKENVIVCDSEKEFGKFMTVAGFGCPYWQEKGKG